MPTLMVGAEYPTDDEDVEYQKWSWLQGYAGGKQNTCLLLHCFTSAQHPFTLGVKFEMVVRRSRHQARVDDSSDECVVD